MSVYRQSNSPNYYYDFAVDGRRYRGSCNTTKITQAKEIEREKIHAARQMGPEALRPRKPVTLQEVAARFFELVGASELAANTQRDYAYGWSLIESTPLLRMQVRSIDADSITMAFTGIASPYAANSALRTMRRILNKAREWSYIAAVPKIKLRKAPGRTCVYGAAAEAELLKHATQPLKDVLLVLLDTGARPFEVMQMRWEDVRWEDRAIHIPKSKTANGIRDVYISDRMMDALLVRCAGQKEGWMFPAGKKSKAGHAGIPNKAFREARDAAGLDKRLVLYTARHTFGTQIYAATGNIFAVAKAMGHANIKSMQTYQHQDLDVIRAAVEKRNQTAARPN